MYHNNNKNINNGNYNNENANEPFSLWTGIFKYKVHSLHLMQWWSSSNTHGHVLGDNELIWQQCFNTQFYYIKVNTCNFIWLIAFYPRHLCISNWHITFPVQKPECSRVTGSVNQLSIYLIPKTFTLHTAPIKMCIKGQHVLTHKRHP